jgi:hypothetical protein
MTVTVTGVSSGAGRLAAMRSLLLAMATFAGTAHAAQPLGCEVRPTGYGAAELACTVDAAEPPGPLRLSVRFGGVHDDSQAGMAASVDAGPLACSVGSTTRIAGEQDGDTLVCRFTLDPQQRDARHILVHLLWFHAEPQAFDLRRE